MAKRKKKLTLRQIVSRLPCVACIDSRDRIHLILDIAADIENSPVISDPHHVSTRGAHGDIDTVENLMPLCRAHHIEWDGPWGGPGVMLEKYPMIRSWLEAAGRTDVLEMVARKSPS